LARCGLLASTRFGGSTTGGRCGGLASTVRTGGGRSFVHPPVAALATAMAARGKRVLVAMCHTKERLSSMLGSGPIPSRVVPVAQNVWSVNLDPEVALGEYGEIVLKVKALAHAVFDNKYAKSFFRATPGLYEWAMLGKAWWHTTERDSRGNFLYDVVLLDAPATGHGLDMLRVPKIILEVVPPGILRRDAELAWAMFRDPVQSGVVLVTLPEEMPVTETHELATAVRDELGLPVLGLVVNGVLTPLFTEAEREALAAHPDLLDVRAPIRVAGTGTAPLVASARRAVRERVQEASLARLERIVRTPTLRLPFLFDEGGSRVGTDLLARYF